MSVQFVQRSELGDAVRGYGQPTRLEWESPAWAHIRAGCTVEESV